MGKLLRICVLGTMLLCIFSPKASAIGSTTHLYENGFPINFLQDIANSPVVQSKLKSRWKWEVWDVVPGVHYFQVYVFNITNPEDVEKGEKPAILQQLGPYYYREQRLKFDVSVNLDLTVNFERNYTYTFDPSKSNGTENDLVNVPNLPLIIFSTIANEVDPLRANVAVNDLTSSRGGESLVRRGVSVGDLLFQGMDVSKYRKYLNLLIKDGLETDKDGEELIKEFDSGRFGIFKLKNGAHEKPFVVDSGLTPKTLSNVGKIVSWNSQRALTWWQGQGTSCNMINGTDSSVFHPYIDKEESLQVFDLDLCRSIDFALSGDMLFRNAVKGWTFSISNHTFEDPTSYQPNQCFCKTKETCLKRGVSDVSNCRGGAPFVMSYAHFLNADPEYLKAVNGLQPDPSYHQTEIDVEPVTGAVINYRKRFQWNIMLKSMPQIDYFQKTKGPLVLPILWNDDTFHLNPDKAQLLEEELASQMGGVGDVASNLLNKLAQSSSERNCKTNMNILATISLLFNFVAWN